MRFRNIEIVVKDSNKKGDLFGRLIGDLFHSLGYNQPRLNIHKSGRELDVLAHHRTELKVAIGECKAHDEKIGGSDINKFIGVLDAERKKIKKSKTYRDFNVVGYFVSTSGFKETAIEQENDLDNTRVVLIDSRKLIDELISGRVIVSIEKAISAVSNLTKDLVITDYADLLVYEKGWIWAIYFSDSKGQKPSHFTLVHAEGNPLVSELAQEVIKLDKKNKNVLYGLQYMQPAKDSLLSQDNLEEAQEKYFKYLENELGEIQFEGLPTDKEAGSVKVKLENIFVPLHLNLIKEQLELDEDLASRDTIGEVLTRQTRLAILAKPGGGKSTLLKRIAIAYAFPSRREEINDQLPNKRWFPIFFRCRELGEKVKLSITEIVANIPNRAEIQNFSKEFLLLVSNALQNGNALLLIDGLDEISEDKNRVAFVNQLRTFIATYPTINIIVTSREAGFRIVGGSLATYCKHYKVSKLNQEEVRELCLKWHKAIIDDSANTISEANKIADIIVRDARLSVLAENPLLLTTLLFVKRWAGYLPTKRSVLYQEMIKLLLVTWNVEGHEQLDIEETEPQLAYVAYWMTKNGQQTIFEEDLKKCLIEARQQMPEILGYTNISPSEFIRRVELRSSLLILSGHRQTESGNISQVYEFLHLSFQEYLTAKAIVKRYLPKPETDKDALEILQPNIYKENWKEVIPLVAVLLERNNKSLIEYLISESKKVDGSKRRRSSQPNAPLLLGHCLANEIQISPELLKTTIEWYAKQKYSTREPSLTETILKNKFGNTFRQAIRDIFFEKYEDEYASPLGSTLGEIFLFDFEKFSGQETLDLINTILQKDSREDSCIALFGLMSFAFNMTTHSRKKLDTKQIFDNALQLLKGSDFHLTYAIAWSIAWSEEAKLIPDRVRIEYLQYLIKYWIKNSDLHNLKRVLSWAINSLLKPTIKREDLKKIPKLKQTLKVYSEKPNNEFDELNCLYLNHILGEAIDRQEVQKAFLSALVPRGSESLTLFAKEFNIDIETLRSKNKTHAVGSLPKT